jgi:hypothetical protein
MPNESICQIHGPYAASLGSCPYCAKSSNGRPQPPRPLDEEDNMPTDIGFRAPGSRVSLSNDDDAPTELPGGRRLGGRILDADDEESTHLGQRRDLDETEVEFNKEIRIEGILWVKEGSRRGQIYKIKNVCVIGRKNTDIIIEDQKVSREHAKLAFKEDHFILLDLLSENGTYVNGEKILSVTTLKENDLIKIGSTVLVLKILEV